MSGDGEPEKEKLKILRGYKTELDLNNRQRSHCLEHAGTARFAYNWGLARRMAAYEATGETLTCVDLHKELNLLKPTDFPWIYQVSKCAPQEALRNLDNAFAHFFRRVKLKKAGKLRGKVGAPAYLSWTRDGSSFLAMIKRDEKFYIQRTDNFPASMEPEEIIKGKYPAISPDGGRLAYLCADQLYLCLLDLETGKILFLAEAKHVKVRGETIPLTAMWSSDSEWVYFASAPEGHWDIFRVHPNGHDLQNLTRAWGDSNEIMPALKWQD